MDSSRPLCITDTCLDPYWNLAAEEYLLKEFSRPVFRLWRNSPAVIIGQNQNAMAEINSDWIRENSVPVVRRLSGGGAVFHDLGNVNFTFIETRTEGEDTSDMFRRFTAPVIAALRSLGVDARLEGRNDLLIGDRKFAGNAIAIHKGRVLQHGCILFSASMASLSQALKSRPEKFIGKAVASNRSRVTNVSEHLGTAMTAEQFIAYLRDNAGTADMEPYTYTEEDIRAISALADSKYRTDEWNFGRSPRFTVSGTAKFPGGLVEAYAEVKDGTIVSVRIMGDYFFEKPTSEVEERLKGIPHKKEAVLNRLLEMDLSRYFSGIPADGIAGLLF